MILKNAMIGFALLASTYFGSAGSKAGGIYSQTGSMYSQTVNNIICVKPTADVSAATMPDASLSGVPITCNHGIESHLSESHLSFDISSGFSSNFLSDVSPDILSSDTKEKLEITFAFKVKKYQAGVEFCADFSKLPKGTALMMKKD